jgi:hypothetical protein
MLVLQKICPIKLLIYNTNFNKFKFENLSEESNSGNNNFKYV